MREIKTAILSFLACVLLAGCGSDDQFEGRVAANVYAIKEARKAQAEISRSKNCPESLSGWQKPQDEGELTSIAGNDKAHYPLFFKCRNNLDFSITVKSGIDSWIYVMGNATGPLEIQYGHFTAPSRLKISAQDDIVAIATKAARG